MIDEMREFCCVIVNYCELRNVSSVIPGIPFFIMNDPESSLEFGNSRELLTELFKLLVNN